MPRFVVLEHDHPELHWDLMLEGEGVLRTWRLASPPEPGRVVHAAASFDHRLFYLDYEGPVSGGRGCVKRWDSGTFSQLEDSDELLVVEFEGSRLRGRRCLRRLPEGAWMLSAEEDGPGGGRPEAPRGGESD